MCAQPNYTRLNNCNFGASEQAAACLRCTTSVIHILHTAYQSRSWQVYFRIRGLAECTIGTADRQTGAGEGMSGSRTYCCSPMKPPRVRAHVCGVWLEVFAFLCPISYRSYRRGLSKYIHMCGIQQQYIYVFQVCFVI